MVTPGMVDLNGSYRGPHPSRKRLRPPPMAREGPQFGRTTQERPFVFTTVARYSQVSGITGEALTTSTQVEGYALDILTRFPFILGFAVVTAAVVSAGVLWTAICSRDATRQKNAMTVIAYFVGLLRPEALPAKDERPRPPRRRPRRPLPRPGTIPAGGTRPPGRPRRRT